MQKRNFGIRSDQSTVFVSSLFNSKHGQRKRGKKPVNFVILVLSVHWECDYKLWWCHFQKVLNAHLVHSSDWIIVIHWLFHCISGCAMRNANCTVHIHTHTNANVSFLHSFSTNNREFMDSMFNYLSFLSSFCQWFLFNIAIAKQKKWLTIQWIHQIPYKSTHILFGAEELPKEWEWNVKR